MKWDQIQFDIRDCVAVKKIKMAVTIQAVPCKQIGNGATFKRRCWLVMFRNGFASKITRSCWDNCEFPYFPRTLVLEARFLPHARILRSLSFPTLSSWSRGLLRMATNAQTHNLIHFSSFWSLRRVMVTSYQTHTLSLSASIRERVTLVPTWRKHCSHKLECKECISHQHEKT